MLLKLKLIIANQQIQYDCQPKTRKYEISKFAIFTRIVIHRTLSSCTHEDRPTKMNSLNS